MKEIQKERRKIENMKGFVSDPHLFADSVAFSLIMSSNRKTHRGNCSLIKK